MQCPPSQSALRTVLLTMGFQQRLVAQRKARGLTQQALADLSKLNVVQIRRWETGATQPSLEALMKLARGLHSSTDQLLFGEAERGPDDDLRLQFEATTNLDADEKLVIKALIEGILLRHEGKRWTAAS